MTHYYEDHDFDAVVMIMTDYFVLTDFTLVFLIHMPEIHQSMENRLDSS